MTNTDILKNGFTDKATYLKWRTAWKENYAALTKEIREYKNTRKNKDAALRGQAQYQCWRLRQQATLMIEQRKQSKITAQQQYLASRSSQNLKPLAENPQLQSSPC